MWYECKATEHSANCGKEHLRSKVNITLQFIVGNSSVRMCNQNLSYSDIGHSES